MDYGTEMRRVKSAAHIFPGVQIIGKTVDQLIRDAGLQAECMNDCGQISDAGGSRLMDLSVEASVLADGAVFEDEVPTVVSIVSTPEDVAQLQVPADKGGRCFYRSHPQGKEQITDRVLAGVTAVFIGGRLPDMTEIMVCCMDEPEMTHQLLEKATAFIIKYAQGLKMRARRHCWRNRRRPAVPGFNAEFSVPYVKQVDALQDAGFIVVYHNCARIRCSRLGIFCILERVCTTLAMDDLGDMAAHPEDVLFSKCCAGGSIP